ncbi:serine/threonine protein kinase [Roseovarius phycicola]|uniref:Serine/threonine-protein kinase n=1 Tax=Roseovarius phycicola TaxID=3080976 RepID=A0ABZ2HNX4_9RHOB
MVIKECFPQDLCTRAALRVCPKSEQFTKRFDTVLDQFKHEAYRLAALEHPGIVRVHQVFEENGTAFLGMDFVNGEDLCTIVEEFPERLDGATLLQVVTEALEAVQYTHEQGILHRDLAPDNFIIDARNRVTLIDFGSSLEAENQAQTASSKLLAVKDGYSPFEFYDEAAQHDVVSDIYALGATFHYLVTGYTPPDAEIRRQSVEADRQDPFEPLRGVDWDLDQGFLNLINQALNIYPQDRIASAAQWLQHLNAAPAAQLQSQPQPQAQVQAAVPATPDPVLHVQPDTPAPAVDAPKPLHAPVKDAPVSVPDPRVKASMPTETENSPKQKTLAAAPPPDPTAIPLDAPEIVSKISQLVSDTNSKFKPGVPQLLRTAEDVEREQAAKAEVAKPKSQPVDIFGNPIEDVDAFLAEQDGTQRGKKRKSKNKAGTNSQDPSMEQHADSEGRDPNDPKPARKGAMGRFFNKLLPGKESGDSVVLQN